MIWPALVITGYLIAPSLSQIPPGVNISAVPQCAVSTLLQHAWK